MKSRFVANIRAQKVLNRRFYAHFSVVFLFSKKKAGYSDEKTIRVGGMNENVSRFLCLSLDALLGQ
jgi:hypothetical protein